MNSMTSSCWSGPLLGLVAAAVGGCVQPPVTTRAERVAADQTARAQMKAAVEQCEQAREQMGRAGSMRLPTPEMGENMRQCQASEVVRIKPTGIHF